jgi:hypothetical protein
MKKVRCINNLGFENRLEENKIYTVAKEINRRYILEDIGDAYEFVSERFEEIEEKKGLNIIEAMRMPVGTEFKVIFNGEHIENNTMIIYRSLEGDKGDKDKHMDWKCHPQYTFMKPYDYLINGVFIPIPQPVGFMEVVESNKKCKVEHELMNDLLNSDITLKEFNNDELEYKWFLEYSNKGYLQLNLLMDVVMGFFNAREYKTVIKEGKWYLSDEEDIDIS